MQSRYTKLKKEREYLLNEYNKAKKSDKIKLLVQIMDLEAQIDIEKNNMVRRTS